MGFNGNKITEYKDGRDSQTGTLARGSTFNNEFNRLYDNDNYLKDNKLDVAGGSITGNLVVQGDLTVQGNTTQINTTELLVKDKVVVLNKDEPGSGVSGDGISGIEVERGSGENAKVIFDESDDQFKAGVGADVLPLVRLEAGNQIKADKIRSKSGAAIDFEGVMIQGKKITGSIFFPRAWNPGEDYFAGEVIVRNYSKYMCAVGHNHTAGASFAVDWITNGHWVPLGDFPGCVRTYSGIYLPPGYYWPDAGTLSMATHEDLWFLFHQDKGACTFTIGTSGIVNLTNHGFISGQRGYLTTTGVLPTGGAATYTTYWITVINENQFYVSSSWANYINHQYVQVSAQGSGTHSFVFAPWGIISNSQFSLPDPRGLFQRFAGTNGLLANANGVLFSGALGRGRLDMLHAHHHIIDRQDAPGNPAGAISTLSGGTYTRTSTTANDAPATALIRAGAAQTDTLNGVPRVGDQTSPAEADFNCIIKF